MQEQQLFGWKKDRFKGKDRLLAVKPGVKVRDLVNFADYLYTPAYQTDSSCVGQTFRSYAKGLAKLFGVPETFSSTWIYNLARWLEGTLMSDEGCFPRDALDMLIKKGFLPEKLWPYKGFDTTSPPSKFDPEAAKWPVLTAPDVPQSLGFYRVTGGAEGIYQALSDAQVAIEAGKPEFVFVAIGIPWPDKWMSCPKSGLLPKMKTSDSLAGGHMILVYAGDYKRGLIYKQNSWGNWGVYPLGKTKGDKGCCIIEAENFEVFKKLGGYDAQIVKVKWGAQPEPVPEPEPISGKYKVAGELTLVPT
jgi:hypothetical protein